MNRIPFGDFESAGENLTSFEDIEMEFLRESEQQANKEKLKSLTVEQLALFIDQSLSLIEDLGELVEFALNLTERDDE